MVKIIIDMCKMNFKIIIGIKFKNLGIFIFKLL